MRVICAALLISIFPFSALAESYEYKCFSYYWNGYARENGTMTLTVGPQSATANIVEESWDDGDLGGLLNPAYRSRGAIIYKKFGNSLILEESLLSGGKRLRDGALGGFARVEGEAEGGFYQYKFICKAK